MSYSVITNVKDQGERLLGKLIDVDLNTTNDQSIDIISGNKRITRIVLSNASSSISTSVGGIYDGAGKTGVQYVSSAQSYSGLKETSSLEATLAEDYFEGDILYFSLTTAEGSAETCDIYVYGELL